MLIFPPDHSPPSSDQDAEPAGGRYGRVDQGLLQLLRQRRGQVQAQQGRAQRAPQQRAHRLPHGNANNIVFLAIPYLTFTGFCAMRLL